MTEWLTMGWALIALFVIDSVLAFTWNKHYFRYGIPIYKKQFEALNLVSEKKMADELKHNGDFFIKPISENELAIRDPFGVLSGSSILHGVLRLNNSKGTVKLIGYVDLTRLLFGVMLILTGSWMAVPYFATLLAFYGSAKAKYDKLCSAAKAVSGAKAG